MSCHTTKPTKWRAPSEDTDEPGHLPSLISLHCLHEEALGPWLSIEHTAKTLIKQGGCPGLSESAGRTGQFVCFVMHMLIKVKYLAKIKGDNWQIPADSCQQLTKSDIRAVNNPDIYLNIYDIYEIIYRYKQFWYDWMK